MRYCSKCGAMNDTDANFCQGCGAKFESANAEVKVENPIPQPEVEAPQPEVLQAEAPQPEAAQPSEEATEQAQEQTVNEETAQNTNDQAQYSQDNIYYAGQPVMTMEQKVARNRAIAGMVLGICSLVIPFLNLASGIVGLVLSCKSLKVQKSGMAKAGKVTSIIGIIFSVLAVVFTIILICWFSAFLANVVDGLSVVGPQSPNYSDVYDIFGSFSDGGNYFYNLN